jgi:TetR/AcrR family transcriptional repressor of mexJK operon
MSRPKKIEACIGVPLMSKRQCILAAAQEIFLEMGYAAANMDNVAARANVSKATIYAHFDNKRALFEQVIGSRCQRVFGAFDIPEHVSDARVALRQLAAALFDVILSAEAVAINRVVVAEAPRLPELGEAFYAAGPVPALARVTRMFNDLTRRGLLTVPEHEAPLVAELFLNMLKGDAHMRELLGVPPSRKDHEALLDVAVDLIMARYAPRRPRGVVNPPPTAP